MILKKLRRSKRALSPVANTMFLLAVIIAAIGISMGIVYPQVTQLKERVALDTVGSSFISMDSSLQSVVDTQTATTFFQSINVGASGKLFADLNSYTNVTILKEQGTTLSQPCVSCVFSYSQQYRRLVVQQTVTSDFFPANSHKYLIGASSQSLFYLNSSSQSSYSWPILNQSRHLSNDAYTALSYRYLLSSSTQVDPTTLTQTVNVKIESIKFNFMNDLNSSATSQNVRVVYKGLEVTNENTVKVADTGNTKLVLQMSTYLSDSGLKTVEYPFTQAAPSSGYLALSITFVYHTFDLYY